MTLLFLFPILTIAIIGVVWQRRYTRRRRQMTIQQLRRWIGTHADIDPGLQYWVSRLTTAEASVLVELLTGYCTSLNWELSWLFTPQMEKAPALQQAIEEGVIAYARSILASLQLSDDAHAYKAYLTLVQKPTNRKQFALIQKLYNTLNESGLVTPVATKRTWLRRQPTRKQQIAAVYQAFDQAPALAMETLKTLLIQEAETDIQQLTQVKPPPVGAMTVGLPA